MSDDDDSFWSDYLVDRHQLSSQLAGAERRASKAKTRCRVADVKGNCDCSPRLARWNHA